MKDNLPKNLIIPFLIGIGYYIFLTIGQNADLFPNNQYLNIGAIILGTIVLYSAVYGLTMNSNNLFIGAAGYNFGRIMIAFIAPLIIFLVKVYYPHEKPKHYESLLEAESIEFKKDSNECKKVKYGTFLINSDTLKRYYEKDEKIDLEKLSRNGNINIYRIDWLNDCSYIRINQKNGLVMEVVNIGNFGDRYHQLYIKPASLHAIKDEYMEEVYIIETIANKE